MQTAKKQFTQADYNKLKKMVESQGFKNRLMALAKFIMPFNKKVKLEVNMGGGSYTDGDLVVIGIHEWYWELPWYMNVMAGKALVGHEFEHVVSSDFTAFVAFQEQVYRFFKKNYGLENGRKLGAQLLNCTEDGRIEKRLVNRLKGMLKYIQFLNGTAWEKSPVTGENPLMEYTLNVCYMATSGIWMKGFDEVYGGTRMEEELEKVKPLIIKAINQPSTKACGAVTMEIIKANADFIAEMLDPANQPSQNDESGQSSQSGQSGQGDPTDSLDRTSAPTTTRAMADDDVELSESSHFVDEEENKKPKPTKPKQAKKTEKDEEEENGDESGTSSTSQDEEQEGNEGEGSSSESEDDEQEGTDGSGASDDSEDSDNAEEGDEGEGQGQEGADDNTDSQAGQEEGEATGEDEEANQDSGNDSQGSEGDSQSDSQSDNDSSQPSDQVSNGSDVESNDEHPEDGKSIDEMIREALANADEELREENEKAIEQSSRENEKIEREENRINQERQKVALSKKEKAAIMNLPGGVQDLAILYEDGTEFEDPIPADLKNKTRTFRKEVEKIFLNKKGFNKRNRRQGRLDVNQLWRVPLGDKDLFSQKGRPQDTDYAVSVLVDNSGSMSERIKDSETGRYVTKSEYAKDAVITLEEGLRGIVPLMITQFDFNHYHGIHHKIIRSFEDSSDNNRTQERVHPDRTGGGNGDGYSIKIAHRQLMKRPERQKVMFVLSDGEPSAYYGYDTAYNHVNEAVKEAREDGVIVIAMRFGTPEFLMDTADAYKRMYEHSYLACEPADMRKELVKLMKNVIK